MKKKLALLAGICLAVTSNLAFAWNDVDVPINLEGLDYVNLLRKGHKCVHVHDTDQKSYGDKSTIHVSFEKSGDDCDENSDKHLDMQLQDAEGAVACNITIGMHGNKGKDSHYLTVSPGGGYRCVSTSVNNQPVLDIQKN